MVKSTKAALAALLCAGYLSPASAVRLSDAEGAELNRGFSHAAPHKAQAEEDKEGYHHYEKVDHEHDGDYRHSEDDEEEGRPRHEGHRRHKETDDGDEDEIIVKPVRDYHPGAREVGYKEEKESALLEAHENHARQEDAESYHNWGAEKGKRQDHRHGGGDYDDDHHDDGDDGGNEKHGKNHGGNHPGTAGDRDKGDHDGQKDHAARKESAPVRDYHPIPSSSMLQSKNKVAAAPDARPRHVPLLGSSVTSTVHRQKYIGVSEHNRHQYPNGHGGNDDNPSGGRQRSSQEKQAGSWQAESSLSQADETAEDAESYHHYQKGDSGDDHRSDDRDGGDYGGEEHGSSWNAGEGRHDGHQGKGHGDPGNDGHGNRRHVYDSSKKVQAPIRDYHGLGR